MWSLAMTISASINLGDTPLIPATGREGQEDCQCVASLEDQGWAKKTVFKRGIGWEDSVVKEYALQTTWPELIPGPDLKS